MFFNRRRRIERAMDEAAAGTYCEAELTGGLVAQGYVYTPADPVQPGALALDTFVAHEGEAGLAAVTVALIPALLRRLDPLPAVPQFQDKLGRVLVPGRLDEVGSDDLASLRMRGSLYFSRGMFSANPVDIDGSIRAYSRALELDPLDAMTWLMRCQSRMQTDDLEAAERDASKALDLEPEWASAWLMRSDCRRARGDEPGACSDETQAARFDPALGNA